MNKTNATTITSVLKTLTLVLALTITSQAVHAQHTQGPTVEGVALPNLGGGEEGEIREGQIIEVQRQCNESLVKEYLYNGSSGKYSLITRLDNDRMSAPINTQSQISLIYQGKVTNGLKVLLKQEAYSHDINVANANVNLSGSYLSLQLYKDDRLLADLRSKAIPIFFMTVDRKWDLDGLGAIVNVKNVVTGLKIVRFEEDSINFKAKQQDGSEIVVFSYPTAKYVSCLKAGVASLAK